MQAEGEDLSQLSSLALRLKGMREAARLPSGDPGKTVKLTGAALAERAGWGSSRSKVSKIEKSQQMPTEEDIRQWAEATGYPELVGELIELRSAAQTVHREWKHQLRQGQAALQGGFDKIVREASRIRDFQTFCVSGLLQTPEYVRYRALEAVRVHGTDPDKVSEVVAARMRRQDVLWDPGKQFEFLFTQTALDYWMGPPEVMLGQLGRLQAVIGMPNVRFGIIPPGKHLSVCPMLGFLMADELVIVETFTSADSILGQEAAKYGEIMDMMWADAVEGEDARQIIATATDSLRLIQG